MKYTPFLLLLFFLANFSCKKDGLTKETQKGANTFSCKIDSKIFRPCYQSPIIGGVDIPALDGGVNMIDGRRRAVVYANNQCNNAGDAILLEISNLTGEGEYSLADSDNQASYRDRYSYYYLSNYTRKGKIAITKDDETNKILSGTFEFSAEDSTTNPGKIVEITSGRFDISYK